MHHYKTSHSNRPAARTASRDPLRAANLDEPKILHALRLDPCAGKGIVRLDSLQLKDVTGKILKQWP